MIFDIFCLGPFHTVSIVPETSLIRMLQAYESTDKKAMNVFYKK